MCLCEKETDRQKLKKERSDTGSLWMACGKQLTAVAVSA